MNVFKKMAMASAGLLLTATTAVADYPEKPVEFVVP